MKILYYDENIVVKNVEINFMANDKQMSSFFSICKYVSGEFGCSEEALIVCAMTQIQNVFVTPSGKKVTAVSAAHFLIEIYSAKKESVHAFKLNF